MWNVGNSATPVRLNFFPGPCASGAYEAAVLVSLLEALKELKAVRHLKRGQSRNAPLVADTETRNNSVHQSVDRLVLYKTMALKLTCDIKFLGNFGSLSTNCKSFFFITPLTIKGFLSRTVTRVAIRSQTQEGSIK